MTARGGGSFEPAALSFKAEGIVSENIFEDFDFLRILFSPGVAVPLLLVLSAAFLMRRFYVLNCRSDDMRKFIAAGGNKLDDEEFRRFVRMRRLFGNALIISSLTAVVSAYAAFCAFCVF